MLYLWFVFRVYYFLSHYIQRYEYYFLIKKEIKSSYTQKIIYHITIVQYIDSFLFDNGMLKRKKQLIDNPTALLQPLNKKENRSTNRKCHCLPVYIYVQIFLLLFIYMCRIYVCVCRLLKPFRSSIVGANPAIKLYYKEVQKPQFYIYCCCIYTLHAI